MEVGVVRQNGRVYLDANDLRLALQKAIDKVEKDPTMAHVLPGARSVARWLDDFADRLNGDVDPKAVSAAVAKMQGWLKGAP